jgi:hypothetical protein
MSRLAELEQRRWLVALTVPLVLVAASVAAALATAGGAGWTDWLFAPAVLLAPIWITTLAFLALTSDTNGTSIATAEATVHELHVSEAPERKAA